MTSEFATFVGPTKNKYRHIKYDFKKNYIYSYKTTSSEMFPQGKIPYKFHLLLGIIH